MAQVTIEKVGELAVMQITRDNGEIIAIHFNDIKEIVNSQVGVVSLIQMTGTEVPFE